MGHSVAIDENNELRKDNISKEMSIGKIEMQAQWNAEQASLKAKALKEIKEKMKEVNGELIAQRERVSEMEAAISAKEEKIAGMYASWSQENSACIQLQQELLKYKQEHSELSHRFDDKEAETDAMHKEWQKRIMNMQAHHHKEIRFLMGELKLQYSEFIEQDIPWNKEISPEDGGID